MEHDSPAAATRWHRLAEVPDEGRVFTSIVGGRSIALTRCGGTVGAMLIFPAVALRLMAKTEPQLLPASAEYHR